MFPPSSPTSGPASQQDGFFCGISQEDPYQLNDPLELDLYPDPYYTFTGGDSSDANAFTAHDSSPSPTSTANAPPLSTADFASLWTDSPRYAPNSLHLIGTTPALPTGATLDPSSPTAHDAYFGFQRDPLHSDPHASRILPGIRIETVWPVAPNATPSSFHARSPFERSPSALVMGTPCGQSSPSSSSSYPPATPQSPYGIVSPVDAPFVKMAQYSPLSPSVSAVPPAMLEDQGSLCTPVQRERDEAPHRVLPLAQMYGHPSGGELVPQPDYRPHTQSDRRRYVEQVQLEAPILFFMAHPTALGIPLKDAINNRFMHLQGRDDPMFEGRGPSVSIRLNWPGYAPWSRQIPTRDFRSPPHPITRAKLAKNVAKTINRFIEDMERTHMEDPTQARWRVGGRHIKLEDLLLVGLQHVSMGSWQAHVRLLRKH
ncbi:hypothetical protein OH77DRAFT_1050988 [Trametes cingulata]|nr:hypothetical protein OH77DRAFT_1050988 [Trametes cingulata]